jgi:hypothetical protein
VTSIIRGVCSSPNIIRIKYEMSSEYSTLREKSDAYMILVGKPEGKRQLVRSRHRWEYNIKILEEYDVVVWTRFIWLIIGTSRGLL